MFSNSCLSISPRLHGESSNSLTTHAISTVAIKAKYITQKVMQSEQNNFLVVEPNIKEHSVFKLTNYLDAYKKADIIVFLVAHKEFKTLVYNEEKLILDFAGIFKRN